MSKRRTEPQDIRNPENYFNRFIALEVERDKEQQKAYYEMFESLDEMLAGGSGGVSGGTLMRFATNLHDDEFERCIAGTYSFAWIELIDNPKLYGVVSKLPPRQKELLTLRFHFCLSQVETAQIMGIAQQTISRYEKRIFKKIKEFLK